MLICLLFTSLLLSHAVKLNTDIVTLVLSRLSFMQPTSSQLYITLVTQSPLKT